MRKGIFVTGTGTDVGKTFVTALIVKALREAGLSVCYYKPALSGAIRNGDALVPGDAKYVCDTAGIDADPGKLVSYMFERAVSPHFASRLERSPITLEKIERDFLTLCDRYDYIVAEGCGGIACPLAIEKGRTIMLSDAAQVMGLPAVIVSDSGVGSIGASVMAAEYARLRGLSVAGIIMNRFDRDSDVHLDNRSAIERLTDLDVIASVSEGEKSLAPAERARMLKAAVGA